MNAMVRQEPGGRKGRGRPGQSPMHRRKRSTNLAILAVLVAFIVLVYLVSLVRMGGW